jgi:hypothetical protein
MIFNWIKDIFSVLCVLLFSLAANAQSDEQKLAVNQDFATLFNGYRVAQPQVVPWAGSYFGYANNGTAVGLQGSNRYKDKPELSPIYKYDTLFNSPGTPATKFEIENHSCDKYTGETKAGCVYWWGHCNGWAAAALKEREPRQTVVYKGETLEVGHLKGILSELWLSTNSYFVGNTDKRTKTSEWIYDPKHPSYKAYWDVTPKQMFFIFVNQIGIQKVGVIIDMFAGDEVWNQPIAGYRILPIRPTDIGTKEVEGQTLHYADIRMKIYWADDLVPENHVSAKFDILQTTDSEVETVHFPAYVSRLLKFKMFFNEKLEVSEDGLKVLNSPKVVHGGLWQAQERQGFAGNPDRTHPDFIWQPINPYIVNSGYENPHLSWNNVKTMTQVIHGEPNPNPGNLNPPAGPIGPAVVFKIVVDGENLMVTEGDAAVTQDLIIKIFKRAGLNVSVDSADIQFLANKNIGFSLTASAEVTKEAVSKALADASVRVLQVE